MYMLNFHYVAIGFVGPHIRNNLYDFFFRKVEGFFNANLHRNGLYYGRGGRTFFESIPSNILTMILIGASLYLIGVIFIYGRNIGTTTLSGIFCTRSCCLSLRCYLIGGRV
jgi:hypothetical protein